LRSSYCNHDFCEDGAGTDTIMTDPRERPRERSREGGSRRGAIAGLLIAAAMLAAGLWLARELTAASKMQDCLMSGRTNCNVIQPAQ
jgi:hypothetical protein